MHPDRTATLVCEDGDYSVYSEEIPFTKVPLDTVTVWFATNVVYLPSTDLT